MAHCYLFCMVVLFRVTLASDAYRYMYRSPPSQGNKTDAKEWDFVSSEEVMTEALKNDDVFEQEVRNMNIPELPPINYKLPYV